MDAALCNTVLRLIRSFTGIYKLDFLYNVLYILIYPNTVKHQSKPQVYKSDIAPCGQI